MLLIPKPNRRNKDFALNCRCSIVRITSVNDFPEQGKLRMKREEWSSMHTQINRKKMPSKAPSMSTLACSFCFKYHAEKETSTHLHNKERKKKLSKLKTSTKCVVCDTSVCSCFISENRGDFKCIPFYKKSKRKRECSSENVTVGSEDHNAHSIIYGQFIKHVHSRSCNLRQHH